MVPHLHPGVVVCVIVTLLSLPDLGGKKNDLLDLKLQPGLNKGIQCIQVFKSYSILYVYMAADDIIFVCKRHYMWKGV